MIDLFGSSTPETLLAAVVWWYPLVVWAMIFVATAQATQTGLLWLQCMAIRWLGKSGLPSERTGPQWLPWTAILLVFVPVEGLPLGRWLHGFNVVLCIPYVAMLLNFLTESWLSRPLLDERGKRTGLWWGLIGGVLLYPMALGLGPLDPYTLGWQSPGVAIAAAGVGGFFLLRGNSFGYVLLAAGLAWQVGCLESSNAWDYLLDPVFCLLSASILFMQSLRTMLAASRLKKTLKAAVATAVIGVAMLGLCPAQAVASTPSDTIAATADHAEEWSVTATTLSQRAAIAGHERLATLFKSWQLPEDGDRQVVLNIPASLQKPSWVDTADEQALWDDFCAARRVQAAGTFELAILAAQAPTVPDAGLQRRSETLRLIYQTLRDDPEHARAREAGGWVQRDGQWVWPNAARRLDKGEEYSPRFGWLPRGRQARYHAGQRYAGGRWISAEADDSRPRTVERGWKFVSDHWLITSTADLSKAARLAQSLEETHLIWRQAFGSFLAEGPLLEKQLTGPGRAVGRDLFAAMLMIDRKQYVAELEKIEPLIARTLGIYWTPTQTAWFFDQPADPADDDSVHRVVAVEQEPKTIHHEATHQLFAEMRKTSPLAGERCGFWAIEAAACYMESLTSCGFGWTLGGRDAGRVPAARERIIEDNFHVPLVELTAMGRQAFQADERLPQIYSEISGLADFFMNGQRARYRASFVGYLLKIYTGTVEADTLAQLCHRSYAELDEEYRRHMAR